MLDYSKKILALSCFSFLIAWFTPKTAEAQIELPQAVGYAGLALGYADPTNSTGRFAYGADLGLFFPYGLSGSAFLLSSAGKEGDVDTMIMHYGVGAYYAFNQFLPGLRFGGRVGAGSAKVDKAGVSATETNFALGPYVGYDFTVNNRFTIGAESTLMFNMGDAGYSTPYLMVTGKFLF